jgi:hypothetical protein
MEMNAEETKVIIIIIIRQQSPMQIMRDQKYRRMWNIYTFG